MSFQRIPYADPEALADAVLRVRDLVAIDSQIDLAGAPVELIVDLLLIARDWFRKEGAELRAAELADEYESLAGRALAAEDALGFIRAALVNPPEGTRVEHDPKGRPLRILIPGVTC